MVMIDQSFYENMIAFKTLEAALIDMGIQISNYLVEYFFLLMEISSEKNNIQATLSEVEIILRCLSVDENSVVINTFISVLEIFDKTRKTSAISNHLRAKGKLKEETSKVIHSCVFTGIKYNLFHLITMEILLLEVSFRYPDRPLMVINELFLAKAIYLKDHVFKDKLERVNTKINELKDEMISIGDSHYSTNDHLIFHRRMEYRIQMVWNKLDLKPGAA
ncbi:hypothetical protein TorRG33x02_259740 [Trema orientale]|uniref:Uncharacterized protein n=1 Tax=Trema orientale TaxID=63057 RepID=A0A2P5D762_TREOI|nr:hypothetical protein TorRG33x02_259740 [Trema orientale]